MQSIWILTVTLNTQSSSKWELVVPSLGSELITFISQWLNGRRGRHWQVSLSLSHWVPHRILCAVIEKRVLSCSWVSLPKSPCFRRQLCRWDSWHWHQNPLSSASRLVDVCQIFNQFRVSWSFSGGLHKSFSKLLESLIPSRYGHPFIRWFGANSGRWSTGRHNNWLTVKWLTG